jgi:ABC-type transport system substrate-binding protein
LAEVPGFRRNEVSRAPDVRLVSRRELTLSFIGLNVTIPPLNDPKVRQAMAMATDRMAAIRLNPAGQLPASAILPPGMSCYSPETRIYPFDLERARSVLAEAGYPRGRGLPPIKFYTSRSTVRGQMVDSVMVSTWRSAGLPVECVRTDWLDLQRRLDRYELPVFSLSWIADIPDPDSFVGSLFASYSQNNYFRYFSAQVDSLLSAARKVVDPRSRQQIYGRIEKTILSEAPVIPLYTSTTAYGLGKQFHELELTPLGISCVDFAHVWMDQENHASRRVP